MKKIAVIGGGASGMACALFLSKDPSMSVTVLERGNRLGKKLSATGNGQGNVTNFNEGAEHYFSDDREKVARALARFGARDTVRFLQDMGGLFLPDGRGRVYPAGRQASAVTDLFRGALSHAGVQICLETQVNALAYDGQFRVSWRDGHMRADAVVLAGGGMAAPNFGTDGNAYALARAFGHTLTECSPALVQLKTDGVRGLKGIRADAVLRLVRKGETIFECRGDVLFTDSGISGDAVFRASSYARKGDGILIDFLPDVQRETLCGALRRGEGEACLLCIVNNGLGRALWKRAQGDRGKVCTLVKNFPLTVTGTLGFAYAQVTKGGIPLCETDDNFMSVRQKNLYFTGEILNVDGECGGYNLQWAFTSAYCAAEGIKR